jgi:four helix bundle protein
MATIKRFEELEIWKIAREFSRLIYSYSNRSPFDKDFSLKNQIRASSGSMMDNPAEGFERGGRKELIQFLVIAKGSAGEARSQLYRALDENYITKDEFEKAIALVENFSSQTQKFIQYLNKTEISGVRYKVEESSSDYLAEEYQLPF